MVVVLPTPLTPHHEHDRRTVAQRERRIEPGEALLEVLAQHALEVDWIGRVVPRDARAQLLDHRIGDVGPEVGGDQGVLEIGPGLLVDGRPGEQPAERARQRPGWSHAASLGAFRARFVADPSRRRVPDARPAVRRPR